MKFPFQKTIVAFWLASLLVSTTGVAFHRVYCFCKKETTFSLFFEGQDACQADEAVEKSLENLPVCCREIASKKAASEPSCCSKKGGEKSRCTKHDVKISKLDAKFLSVENAAQLVDYQVVTSKISPPSLPFSSSIFESEKESAASLRGPPPRFSGRELRVFLMSFRC